jgi:hypothetical protein
MKEGKKLKNREISMLFMLAIVGIAALTIYFVLFPMYTNLSVLEAENETLRAREIEMSTQIDRSAGYQQMHDEAKTDYSRYISYFYRPMDPETIDERISGMLIAHGMTPSTLTMTGLQVEGVPPYLAQELRAAPVPKPLDIRKDESTAAEDGQESSGSGTASADAGDPVGEAAPASPGQEEFEDYAFVYTVTVSAQGDREHLYTFLAQTAPMTAMEVTGFSYDDPVDKNTPGTVNMTIKLYVFVEGVPANEQAGGK